MTTVDGSALETRAPLVSIARCALCGVEALRFDPAARPVSWAFPQANPIPSSPFFVEFHVCGDWRLGRLEEVGFLYELPRDLGSVVWREIEGPVWASGYGVPVPLGEVFQEGAP